MSQPPASSLRPQRGRQYSPKGCIARLILFVVLFPVGLIAVQYPARSFYFHPLCQSFAQAHSLTFVSYDNGGRTSPPSCVVRGRTGTQRIPLRELDDGWLPTIAPVLVDIVSIAVPLILSIGIILLLPKQLPGNI